MPQGWPGQRCFPKVYAILTAGSLKTLGTLALLGFALRASPPVEISPRCRDRSRAARLTVPLAPTRAAPVDGLLLHAVCLSVDSVVPGPSFITHTPSRAGTALFPDLDSVCECLDTRVWKSNHSQLLFFANIWPSLNQASCASATNRDQRKVDF